MEKTQRVAMNFLIVKNWLKWLLQPRNRRVLQIERELDSIKSKVSINRVSVDGQIFHISHAASFYFMYKEIFLKEIYKFKCAQKDCKIIDAGANIGLSVIYFKKLYPQAHIIAFEPDPQINSLLHKNIAQFHLQNVNVIPKALWNEVTTLHFLPDGSDGGRIGEGNAGFEVETTLLSGYLKSPIAMLKIDIEGAEVEVLEECKDLLFNVQNMFVEYHSFTHKKQDLAKLTSILETAGFKMHMTNPALASEQAFIKRRESGGMDMQLNIYCFRT